MKASVADKQDAVSNQLDILRSSVADLQTTVNEFMGEARGNSAVKAQLDELSQQFDALATTLSSDAPSAADIRAQIEAIAQTVAGWTPTKPTVTTTAPTMSDDGGP
jgi:hypothetical protein